MNNSLKSRAFKEASTSTLVDFETATGEGCRGKCAAEHTCGQRTAQSSPLYLPRWGLSVYLESTNSLRLIGQ